jgi:DNA polymerase-3 subunit delta'
MHYQWQSELWARLTAMHQALPHALLLHGPAGVGKEGLADALAAWCLCAERAPDSVACGRCAPCRLRAAGNHPDLRWVRPAADEVAADGPVAPEPEVAARAVGPVAAPHAGAKTDR